MLLGKISEKRYILHTYFLIFSICLVEAKEENCRRHQKHLLSYVYLLFLQARLLENQIDVKLIELSKLGTSLKSPLASKEYGDSAKVPLLSEEENTSNTFDLLTEEIDQLMTNLESVNTCMNEWTESHAPSAATHHTLQRHKEILIDYKQEYFQTKNNIATQVKRQELLGSNRIQSNGDFSPDFRMNLLLKESEHVRNSERLIDDQISIAIEARDTLVNQRQTFKAIQTKLNDISNRFPMINNLIQKINLRKRRDAVIVAVVIGLCLTFLLWWMIA